MKKHFILVLILLIAALLRFYKLSGVPVALNGDEAAFGYNAYSILKTGKDEYGQPFPLIFKSFGDYKLPVFTYVLVPFVASLGLTEFAIRFPIAFVGFIQVLLVYLISQKLFKSRSISLLAALFVSISPWGINFSRGAWDATLALFFATLAIYLFLIGFKKRFYIFISVILFAICLYTYHAERVAVPLLLVSLLFFYRRNLRFRFKKQLLIWTIFLVLAVPALVSLTNFSGQSRAKGSLITDYIFYSTKDKYYQQDEKIISERANILTVLWHSRIPLTVTDMTSKVFAYISPANLFVFGDEVGRHGVEDFGVIYIYDFILIIAAVYFYIKKPDKTSNDKFLIVWLLIGLLPAMVTKDRLHSIRSLLALPPLYIFEAWGAMQLYTFIKNINKLWPKVALIVFTPVVLVYTGRFLQSYFIYTPIERAEWWQYGYKQIVLAVEKEQTRFDKVVVDVPPVYGNPYIFFLFYEQYDPVFYNLTVNRGDDLIHKVAPVYSFDKFEFRQVYWPVDRGVPKTLFIGTSESIPKNDIEDTSKFRLIKEVFMPNGKLVFRIVETL